MKTNKVDTNDEVVNIDRRYLEEVLEGQECGLLNKEGRFDDEVYMELRQEIIEGLYPFIYDCWHHVENRLKNKKN